MPERRTIEDIADAVAAVKGQKVIIAESRSRREMWMHVGSPLIWVRVRGYNPVAVDNVKRAYELYYRVPRKTGD